jgi:hypothetical protein
MVFLLDLAMWLRGWALLRVEMFLQLWRVGIHWAALHLASQSRV